MEPISPELVLVDPDLARVARARLEAAADIAQLRQVAEATTVVAPRRKRTLRWLRRHAVVAFLSMSVAVNGALAAVLVVTGDGAPARAAAAPPKPARMHHVEAASVVRMRKAPARRPKARRQAHRRAPKVKRGSPALKATLPANLIDAKTGLPKSNLQILCRRHAGSPYRCVLRVGANGAPHVAVRYRFHRRGRATTHLRDLGVR